MRVDYDTLQIKALDSANNSLLSKRRKKVTDNWFRKSLEAVWQGPFHVSVLQAPSVLA